jgi:hypothetical protein
VATFVLSDIAEALAKLHTNGLQLFEEYLM